MTDFPVHFWLLVDRTTRRPLATTQPFRSAAEPPAVTHARTYLTELAFRAGFNPDYELWPLPAGPFAEAIYSGAPESAFAIPELRGMVNDTDPLGDKVVAHDPS